MDEKDDVHLYIPAAYRQMWARFRDRIENEGKPLSDVIMELVKGYLGEE
jgi:hypothetical protein